eukprot:587109-Prymnesium_polylepis.1
MPPQRQPHGHARLIADARRRASRRTENVPRPFRHLRWRARATCDTSSSGARSPVRVRVGVL